MWPLNVGQVYSTLGRLERDGMVRVLEERADGQKVYELTDTGLDRLRSWFAAPTQMLPPARDELVLKLVMAMGHVGVDLQDVIQAERRGAVELLQELTVLKRKSALEKDLGWAFVLDSLIFQTEARVRWLDDSEARLHRHESVPVPYQAPRQSTTMEETSEVPS
jgi:DNA-binding PadR family transcriptional regulator